MRMQNNYVKPIDLICYIDKSEDVWCNLITHWSGAPLTRSVSIFINRWGNNLIISQKMKFIMEIGLKFVQSQF